MAGAMAAEPLLVVDRLGIDIRQGIGFVPWTVVRDVYLVTQVPGMRAAVSGIAFALSDAVAPSGDRFRIEDPTRRMQLALSRYVALFWHEDYDLDDLHRLLPAILARAPDGLIPRYRNAVRPRP